MTPVGEYVMRNIGNLGFCVDMLYGMQDMSYTGFFNRLKMLAGCAPVGYVRPMRLQYVAQLLGEKNRPTTETSDGSGFSNVRYFGEMFRKYYGMSPNECRNSMKE